MISFLSFLHYSVKYVVYNATSFIMITKKYYNSCYQNV